MGALRKLDLTLPTGYIRKRISPARLRTLEAELNGLQAFIDLTRDALDQADSEASRALAETVKKVKRSRAKKKGSR